MPGLRLFFAERAIMAAAATSFSPAVRQTGAMTARAELIRRAQAHGMAASYQDWRGRVVEVSDETLAAVLDALGNGQPCPPAGQREIGGARAPWPERRSWGFVAQLYSVRSLGSWGHGDLRDLDLAAWSGRELGADFVLVNPLHAPEPLAPISPSPYLAMTRRHLSPLYLRIEDIPEYAGLSPGDRARVDALGAPLRAANRTAALIDRDAVWAAKRTALEIIHAAGLGPARRAELDAFRERDREAIGDPATWCAIAEVHGPDWRAWPAGLANPRSAEVASLRRERACRGGFPRLAPVAGRGAGQGRAASGPAGRDGHRCHQRPRGRLASRRSRRLGPAGRDRHRRQRRRPAGRVQPARPGLGRCRPGIRAGWPPTPARR